VAGGIAQVVRELAENVKTLRSSPNIEKINKLQYH
jgi:hypothetical protein